MPARRGGLQEYALWIRDNREQRHRSRIGGVRFIHAIEAGIGNDHISTFDALPFVSS